MYEAVHAHPDGDSTVARQALTAAEYGFDGLVVRNHGDEMPDYDADVITDEYDIDVATGVEVRADDVSQARGLVGNHRSERTVVAVHGGDRALNRFAVETPAVDVLAHPMRGDGDFNHVLAAAAAENGVHVEFSFRSVLQSNGGSRVRALQGLRKLRELVVDADAPYVVSADPRSHLELRAPRELVALGETVGFSAEQVRTGLRAWGELAERNREIADESFVEPGVCIEDDG
ncbi:RNase P subunit p30 family protein [Haloarcula marina]|uniref:RNase P subunit p30 family protein n=1 Tax=Haloarcula marina TaxID=2961574 RepID=UPI0020B6F94C|nr:RNase P subunit p30 family protein [Halomicroarcula marina]